MSDSVCSYQLAVTVALSQQQESNSMLVVQNQCSHPDGVHTDSVSFLYHRQVSCQCVLDLSRYAA